jgi:RNA recognition motif-containing protein
MRESEERETGGLGGSARAKRKGFFHHLDQVTTSFFITNLPESVTTGELWKLFLKYGRVGEVYIPKKLDKRGRRFGFVKFKDVEDVEALSDKLRDVWVGPVKIWVNRSRFARSETKGVKSQQVLTNKPKLPLEEVAVGRSYKTAVVGDGDALQQVIKVPVNEEFCKELRGSMVGRLAREKDVKRIQTTLFMEGFPSITVSHMGDNMVLLRSPVDGDVDRLMKSKNECLHYYFSELKPWNPGLIATHREVWVQVYDIPLHIWGEELFKMVGKKLGVFMDFDKETARMVRFDVARLKILSTT